MGIRESYRWLSKSPGDGGQRNLLTRRTFLSSAFAAIASGEGAEISNFDLSLIDDLVVPNDLFFVREHFAAPRTLGGAWKLSITGAVTQPKTYSLEEITSLQRKSLPITLECAENPVGGGLVSHAEWTGVPLASLIEQARPESKALFVRLSGADGFSRSIPIAKALHPDTLLAFSMNGETLPPKHGYPLRAVVPGSYGMDSIKWLNEVRILSDESRDDDRYARLTRSLLTGARPTGRISTMLVKSAFSRPVDGAILRSRKFIIRGIAWSGQSRIHLVEVSIDAGKTWLKASLNEQLSEYSWVLWSSEWKIPTAGDYELVVRATDEQGSVQPSERATDRVDGYELNTWQRIRVHVV